MPPSSERFPKGPYPSGRCSKISKQIFTNSLGTLQTAGSALGLEASESACGPFKSSIPAPYSPLDFLDVSPIGCQSQTLRGLVSPVQVPGVGVPDEGHKPLTPQRDASDLWDPSLLWVTMLGVGLLARLRLCLTYPSWCGPFIIHCEGAVHLAFRSFSGWIVPYVAVDSVYAWEEVSSRSSYAAILDLKWAAGILNINIINSTIPHNTLTMSQLYLLYSVIVYLSCSSDLWIH